MSVLQHVALIGLLVPEAGGAERLLIEAELESIGAGDAVAECPQCGRHRLRLGELRGVWIGRCGDCFTVTVPADGLEELRWKVRDERRAELVEVLDEWAEETAQSRDALFAPLLDAAAGGVRLWRRLRGRRSRGRSARAVEGRAAAAPPGAGPPDPPV